MIECKPELVVEVAKWKQIAIKERVRNNMRDRGPKGQCRASEEHRLAGYPRCVYCLDTGDYHDCPMLGYFMQQATKELGIDSSDHIVEGNRLIELTEERREAIKIGMDHLEYGVVSDIFREEFAKKADTAVEILQDMLEDKQ